MNRLGGLFFCRVFCFFVFSCIGGGSEQFNVSSVAKLRVVFWLSFVGEVGGHGEVSLEVFFALVVVWEESFQFSVEAFLVVEVLEGDGLVDCDELGEKRKQD